MSDPTARRKTTRAPKHSPKARPILLLRQDGPAGSGWSSVNNAISVQGSGRATWFGIGVGLS